MSLNDMNGQASILTLYSVWRDLRKRWMRLGQHKSVDSISHYQVRSFQPYSSGSKRLQKLTSFLDYAFWMMWLSDLSLHLSCLVRVLGFCLWAPTPTTVYLKLCRAIVSSGVLYVDYFRLWITIDLRHCPKDTRVLIYILAFFLTLNHSPL